MGLGNFLKGITAQVNPFDNGKTYGSYNPKKKLQPGDPGYVAPVAAPQPVQVAQAPKIQLKTQSPQNLFAGLNNNLKLPGAPNNVTAVKPNVNTVPVVKPQPGTIVQPTVVGNPTPGITGKRITKNGQMGTLATMASGQTHFVPDAPVIKKQGFFDKLKTGLKDTGEVIGGTVTSLPEVGLAAGRAATGIVEGATQLPHMATSTLAAGTKELSHLAPNRLTNLLNTATQGLNTGTKAVTGVVDKPIDAANRGLDNVAGLYARNVPGAQEGASLYKKEQIPLNILAGLLTLGGSGAAEAGNAGKVSKVSQFFNNPLTKEDNAIAKTAQAVKNRATPVVQALNAPVSSTRTGISRLINSRTVPTAERAVTDAGEVGNLLSDADLQDLTARTQIPVGSSIDVNSPVSEPTSIPVVNNTPQGLPIRELAGDTPGAVRIPTADEVAAQRASERFNAQTPGLFDPRIEGVGNPVSTKDLQDAKDVLDDNLATGKISEAAHADLSQQLADIKPTDGLIPKGQPIQVKSVDSIPVTNQTDVPIGLPETPGTVRATVQTAPNNTESEAIANAPVVAPPAALPKDVQNVLDNPKQFNKRQVTAARNQRKLARQMAKTQEDTADAIDRLQTASPASTSGEGFTSTGKFGKSENGGAYQKVGRKAEMGQALQETSQMFPADVLQTARQNQAETGGFNRRDIRNVMAMFESKRIPRGTPEYNEAKAILKEDGTAQAQALALRGGNVIRRTATADQLTSQYESKIYRLVDDPTKVSSKSFDAVDAANQKFTSARDDATAAYNRFTESPTRSNAKAYHTAQDAAEQADKDSKMTEYKVAQDTLKGNKDPKQVRELEKLAQNADMYQMDAVDASMLSGTGTFSRNLVNSAIGGGEEGLFGGVASRVASAITGENVGGGIGKGTVSGLSKGMRNVVDVSKARAEAAGRNPLEHLKNFATTGNQLGDSIIDSQVSHNVLDHYTQLLKDQGYKGRELADRASVTARQDPDDIAKVYAGAARASAGLGSGITKGSKVETIVKNAISDAISFGSPNEKSEFAAKLLTRMTVGFPSAVGRSLKEGAKRASFGSLNALKLFTKASRDDPALRAQIIKDSIKQAGSGATTGMLFYGLGASGLVTGAYPTDPAERAQWQREGKTENSIKIGGNYYQLPSYLGVAALPALFSASLGRNGGNVEAAVAETAKALPSILPTDQASNVLDVINGRTDATKFATQTAASAARALTPAGALLNQIAKSFDPTQNDTTDGSALSNFVDKVLSGIPGENLFASIPDKTDDAGNVLANPNPLALAAGASSASQSKGVQQTNELNDQTNTTVKTMSDAGAFDDPTLKKVLDGDNLKIYNQIKSGKQVSPEDLQKVQEAMARGVSSTGADTAYLEREQYDTNLTALNVKRDLMASDPTTKPSDLAKMDLAIKRGEVYKAQEVPYDLISDYEGTSLASWRSMGDPKSDDYDPDTYQQLWNIDQALTQAGASYKKGDPSKSKYSAKKAGSGGGGSKSFSSDFGTLKAGVGAPTVQNYQTIDQQSGNIPMIQVVRPNIVHKIGSS